MAVSIYIFDGGALTAAAVTQGTVVPILTKRIVRQAALTNKTGAPIAATVYFVPSGGVAGTNGTTPIYQRSIGIGETYLCQELINKGLNAAGFIQALGNGLEFSYTATETTNG